MSEEPIWIREAEATELLTLDEAIEVLARAYRLRSAGKAASLHRAHARGGESILHAVGGIIAGDGVSGVKTWTYTPVGASPVLVLFSLTEGRVLAVIEAFAMGQVRTAATAGLATRLLAREDAETLALLGTGKQALSQARAVVSVRAIRRIALFGRAADRRAGLAARLRDELEVDVSEHGDVEAALRGADVVTTVTRSAEPIVTGSMLEPGMHVNAVGAIVPSRRELDESAVARFDVVVADSVEQARDDAGELRAAADAGDLDWGSVRGLDELVAVTAPPARAATDMTLFKALGVGLSDVALGAETMKRARGTGAGWPLPARAVTTS